MLGFATSQTWVLAATLGVAPDFSAGIGYEVAQARWSMSPTTAASSDEPPTDLSPRLIAQLAPPERDLARIQGSRRARGLHVAAAFAAQAAMIVAGAVSVTGQKRAQRRAARGRAPAYRPYR